MGQPKVKIRWTIEVTEDYEAELDFEEFAALFEDFDPPPDVVELEAGKLNKGDINAELLADLEDREPEFVSVDERYVGSFEVVRE